METTPVKIKYVVEYRKDGSQNWEYFDASSKEEIAQSIYIKLCALMNSDRNTNNIVEVRLRAKISQSQILETKERTNE